MIIKKIAFGDSKEAFVEERLQEGFNIIFSDDNNKGKTIVIQSSLYAIGNEPIFPSSFEYQKYYHYVEIRLENGDDLNICRKGNTFIAKIGDNVSILDSVSELKRYLNRNGLSFPTIVKDNTLKMVDPILLYQLFFVGQDKKNSSTIFNDSYYKKEDFWELVYSFAGLCANDNDELDEDEVKTKISLLKEEEKVLIKKNKILKSATPTTEMVLQKHGNDAFEEKIKRINTVKDKIVEYTKARNRASSRKLANERALKEIRSLNRMPETGSLYCIDCGSRNIGYTSADKAYTFDISDVNMRSNIIRSIEDKIAAYQEEIDSCTEHINLHQRKLQDLFKEEDVTLESILMYKNEVAEVSDADTRIVDIDKEIKKLKSSLEKKKNTKGNDKKQREELRSSLIGCMNEFYKAVDPTGNLVFDDLFSKRQVVYSGCEGTEFYLSKLYALAKILNHNFPIIMDYFRDGELSSEKEKIILEMYSDLSNQIIFTATLKKQELGKYDDVEFVNAIDYSRNSSSHILSSVYVDDLKTLLKPLMIDLK